MCATCIQKACSMCATHIMLTWMLHVCCSHSSDCILYVCYFGIIHKQHVCYSGIIHMLHVSYSGIMHAACVLLRYNNIMYAACVLHRYYVCCIMCKMCYSIVSTFTAKGIIIIINIEINI